MSASASVCQDTFAFLGHSLLLVLDYIFSSVQLPCRLCSEFSGSFYLNGRCHVAWHSFHLPIKNKVKGGCSNLSMHNWCECTLLQCLCTRPTLCHLWSHSVCAGFNACLDLVWKWNSPIHHHCAWAVVTRVMPFVKLKWDHGNIQLSLCSRQYRRYGYDRYLCQQGRFNTPDTAWKHTVIYLHGSLPVLTYSMNKSRGYNDTWRV